MSLDYNKFEVPFSSVFVAKRRSGKTVLAEYIINKLIDNNKLDIVYIFGKTCKMGDNWKTINDKNKFEELNLDIINHLFEYQRKNVMNTSKKNKGKIPEICLIFDDCIDSRTKGINNKNNLKLLFDDLFTTGRHIHISICVLHQYIKDLISPTTRTNTDYFFISSNPKEVLRYIEEIVIYDNKEIKFIDFINNNTNDNNFVVYDNVIKNNSNRWYKMKADINYLENKKI